MPSVLYSTTCYIKNTHYRLRIYIDEKPENSDLIPPENIPLVTDSLDFTSIDIPVHHIKPLSTRLNFQLIDEKKTTTNTTIPETILLNHLLNIKQTTTIIASNKSTTENFTLSLPTPPLENSGRTQSTIEQSRQLSENSLRRQFSFRRFLSLSINSDKKSSLLLSKTIIKLNYVDVSNSIRWNIKDLELEMDTEELANELYKNLNVCLSTLKQRPRRLLAFVNPLSGKGRARLVYDKKVLPIFQEANIFVNTIYTERANHAQEYILNERLDDYDGLVCVGGDGIFSELCHGLLLRNAHDEQIDINNPKVNILRPRLRIGIIPAGSTDAVVFGTTGLNDPVTSALQIIVGESLLIDITTVHNESGFVRFMATMLAYGFFGNIIEQSDKWRWLGPMRYDLSGFCQFLRHSSYHSELTITLSSNNSISNTESELINNGSGILSVPSDCQQLINNRSNSINKSTESINKIDQFCRKNCGKCAEDIKINSNKDEVPTQIKREGRYVTVNCLNMPCRCAKSKYGMAPFVHLGDGTFDLILVKRSWRPSFLRFLWQVANDGRLIKDLPNVERYRVSEVVIRPINSNGRSGGNWACDGELIYGNEIQIRVHRQALNLFASGIQFSEKYQNENLDMKSTNLFPCFRNKQNKMSQQLNSS